jgi:hypothetical protein
LKKNEFFVKSDMVSIEGMLWLLRKRVFEIVGFGETKKESNWGWSGWNLKLN